MIFVQQHEIVDSVFNKTTIRFCLSDTYKDLFSSDTDLGITELNYVDIFEIKSTKRDLNTDDDKYAVDELGFSIKEYACSTANDVKALSFCLDCSNIDAHRYVAVFVINEADESLPLLDNLDFSGRVQEKLRIKEVLWENIDATDMRGEYEQEMSTQKEIDFTALSIDVAMLEQCKFQGKIYDKTGTLVRNIYDRWASGGWADAETLFSSRLHAMSDMIIAPYLMLAPMGNLYGVLQKYLDYSAEIIKAKTGDDIEFALKSGVELGFEVAPFGWEFKALSGGDVWKVDSMKVRLDKKLKLKLSSSDGDAGQTWSAVFIHRGMLHPSWKYLRIFNVSDFTPYETTEDRSSYPLSFYSLENTSELLFELARAFGCYLRTYQDINPISSKPRIWIEFVPRGTVIGASTVDVYDSDESTIDSSSVVASETNSYYGQATLANADGKQDGILDGYDEIQNRAGVLVGDDDQFSPIQSDKLIRIKKKNEQDKEKKSIEAKRLILTTSPLMVKFWITSGGQKRPQTYPFLSKPFQTTANDGNFLSPGQAFEEILHTGIYVSTNPLVGSQVSRLGANASIFAPASLIMSRIDGEEELFYSLSDYVNRISSREVQFYKQEQTLKVPYLNGFKKDNSETWKNCILGAKISITQRFTRFINNAWVNGTETKDFAIVGIERSYEDFSTSIKMQNISRYAYGYWSSAPVPKTITPLVNSINSVDNFAYKIYELAEDITEPYTAVQVEEDGTIRRINCVGDSYSKAMAVLIESGNTGDFKIVQLFGRVENSEWNFDLNLPVYARSRYSGSNINQTPLIFSGAGSTINRAVSSENMVVELGRPDTSTSFVINVNKYIIEPVFFYGEA